MKNIFLLALFVSFATKAKAEIKVYECKFPNVGTVFFTYYSDGTPARVGEKSGVGNMALYFFDKLSKSMAFVETNMDGFPVTMTTINKELKASHARQLIDISGRMVAPSRADGTCKMSL